MGHDWNEYFKQEVIDCIKYRLETGTKPTVAYCNKYIGHVQYEDINIQKYGIPLDEVTFDEKNWSKYCE